MDQECPYLTSGEVRRALQRLTAADLVRLTMLARTWVRGLSRRNADDLLNEAFERILSGKRAWPSDVDRAAFFNNVMRSIAGQWRKEDRRELLLEDQSEARQETPTTEPDHEVRDLVGRMRVSLADDQHARELFDHWLADSDREEVQIALELDATGYDTARRRMLRSLKDTFSLGWKT